MFGEDDEQNRLKPLEVGAQLTSPSQMTGLLASNFRIYASNAAFHAFLISIFCCVAINLSHSAGFWTELAIHL